MARNLDHAPLAPPPPVPPRRRAPVRSALFNVAFYGWTVAICVAAIPLLLLPGRAPLAALAAFWGRSTLALARVVLGLSVELRGRARLPRRGPSLIAAKHQTGLDGMLMLAHVPDLAIVAMKELLDYPLFGHALRKLEMIMVDRCGGETSRETLARGGQRAFAAGRQIVIFPEGALYEPGERGRYREGIYFLYAALQAPVIPVAQNIGLFWPQRRWLKSPGRAVVSVLEPIPPGLERHAFMAELETRIEAETARLLIEAEPAYGEHLARVARAEPPAAA